MDDSKRWGNEVGLEAVEMIMDVEEEFDIKISDSDAPKLYTANDLVECVLRHLREAGKPAPVDQVWPRIQKILANVSAMNTNEIELGSRFNEDLGWG